MQTVDCIDNKGVSRVVPVSHLRWRPSVYGILLKDSAVLLLRQFGKYELPGGGMKFGEQPEQTLVREVHEETGVTVTTAALQSVQSYLFTLPNMVPAEHIQSVQMVYMCTGFTNAKLTTQYFDPQEHNDAELAEWVPLAQLAHITFGGTLDARAEIIKALAQKAA